MYELYVDRLGLAPARRCLAFVDKSSDIRWARRKVRHLHISPFNNRTRGQKRQYLRLVRDDELGF
ncbi:hypothetical protein DFR67_114145 [Williamsia limnetica]|uniref:Uncharacterized protein n=1 Tax=Williamsia limnetica TaxID=882452 RepID=A0A318RJS8_WILLI|nr:hypothetical protein DFR67_114145 [Williamsia limnetica]